MFDYRAILMFLFGIMMLVGRKDTANQLFKHYSPMLGRKQRALPFLSSLSILIALVFIAYGFYMISFNDKTPDYILDKNFVAGIILMAGITYIIWSIPGYYRWKKTGKGVELALFITKLSIGILTFVGVVVGYVLGKI
jgi:hypothetical protein